MAGPGWGPCDHARARRDEPGLRPAPGDGHRVLRPHGHPQRVREVAVVAEARNLGERPEPPLDLGGIERQQALPFQRCEGRAHCAATAGGAPPTSTRLKANIGVLRASRYRPAAPATIANPTEASVHSEGLEESARARRPLEEESPPRGRAHAGACALARGGFRRGGRPSYPRGQLERPRNSTSCRSSTPNCSRARLRASTISATASSVRLAGVLDEVRVRGEICAPPTGGPSSHMPRACVPRSARAPDS